MGRVVRLAQRRASKETIEALTALLAEAKAGEVIGIAYVAFHAGTEYTGDALGSAKLAPSLTIGTLYKLAHRLLHDDDD